MCKREQSRENRIGSRRARRRDDSGGEIDGKVCRPFRVPTLDGIVVDPQLGLSPQHQLQDHNHQQHIKQQGDPEWPLEGALATNTDRLCNTGLVIDLDTAGLWYRTEKAPLQQLQRPEKPALDRASEP